MLSGAKHNALALGASVSHITTRLFGRDNASTAGRLLRLRSGHDPPLSAELPHTVPKRHLRRPQVRCVPSGE